MVHLILLSPWQPSHEPTCISGDNPPALSGSMQSETLCYHFILFVPLYAVWESGVSGKGSPRPSPGEEHQRAAEL